MLSVLLSALCPPAPLKSLTFWRYTNQIIIIIIIIITVTAINVYSTSVSVMASCPTVGGAALAGHSPAYLANINPVSDNGCCQFSPASKMTCIILHTYNNFGNRSFGTDCGSDWVFGTVYHHPCDRTLAINNLSGLWKYFFGEQLTTLHCECLFICATINLLTSLQTEAHYDIRAQEWFGNSSHQTTRSYTLSQAA